MPFDMFKARVKIVKDEAVVKKWIEEQSSKVEFSCLNVAEPLKLPTMEEVETHFRATHKDSIIKPVDTYTVAGLPSRTLQSSGLQQLIRQEWEHQRHFPLPVATKLSQQLASHGLQFFKVNKTVTHVSVARPQFLDIESTPVSDGIKRIVDYINANAKCTRKKLIEALAPTPKPVAAPKVEIPAPAVPAPAAPAAEGEAAPAPAPVKPAPAPAPEATAEQTAVMVDLHWLIHQGAVLEFADGRMETAKKPLPKPIKQEKKEEKPAADAVTATPETPVTTEAASAAEVVVPAETARAAEALPQVEAAVAIETAPAAEIPAPVAEVCKPIETAPVAAAPEVSAAPPATPAASEVVPAA
jgi:hypothetical protein